MEITPQEQAMLQALRETNLPPLFVLIRLRNEISNDTANISESQREAIVDRLEQSIRPLWDDYHGRTAPSPT
ncbi:hypothetical protein J19TS2_23310 [Cohnella xylanilytica]|uniref:hypothetical protein n=1 Tax=Cohnella xylanilytica TaxID=557555 RepID=UPI001B1CCB08|nr:hypothetical protein [Cohnella xylanilytica]GIO12776.1 hypothetical protein J19TS2_23310 [Cohnella xylanilytica]